MTLDTYTLAIFASGTLAGVALTMLLGLIPDALSSGRLIRFYVQTRDRKRAVRLWQIDELTRSHRRHV